MAGPGRANVLRAYRELLRLVAELPDSKRGAALAEARASLRDKAGLTDGAAASDALKTLWSRIGFLRMARQPEHCCNSPLRASLCAQTLPRRPGGRQRGGGTFVLRDGVLVEATGAFSTAPVAGTFPLTRRTGDTLGERVSKGILDPGEARARHAALLKRQYFGRMPGRLEPF